MGAGANELGLRSVFHPSDFSDASYLAFVHALKIAIASRSHFTILHAQSDETKRRWTDSPPVRGTLERWGLLEANSSRDEVQARLGVRAKKVSWAGTDPVDAILDYLERDPADLIVLAVHGDKDSKRSITRPVAEALAKRSKAITLLLPAGARGFISAEDGRSTLRRVLVPIDHTPDPHISIEAATRLGDALSEEPVCYTALHVGEPDGLPALEIPENVQDQLDYAVRQGDIANEIVAAAEEMDADLIVLTTRGEGGTCDAVTRSATCPVLVVPVDWAPVR
ncbi:MAG: universal stress protein [Planctomycetota bacterium]